MTRDGTVAGSYSEANSTYGFVRAVDGTITPFQSPEGTDETIVASMNESGWIVGDAIHGPRGHAKELGFLRSPSGDFSYLGKGMWLAAINSRGTVTGYLDDNSGEHAFIRTSDGTVTTFDPSGQGAIAYPQAINIAGTVVGDFGATVNNVNVTEGFIRAKDGGITTFAVPGDDVTGTMPSRINKAGTVVGFYQTSDGRVHGFTRSIDGSIIPIDVPGAAHTWAFGINDKGRVSGTFQMENGINAGFIWRP